MWVFSLSCKSPGEDTKQWLLKPDPLSHWAVQDYLFGSAKKLDCWKMLYELVIACAKQQLSVFVVITYIPGVA